MNFSPNNALISYSTVPKSGFLARNRLLTTAGQSRANILLANFNTDASPAVHSPDSRSWVFHTAAALVPSDTNEITDVYELNIATGKYKIISTTSQGLPGNSTSYRPFYSSDGRFIVFTSRASNFLRNTTGYHLYAKDRVSGILYLYDAGGYGQNLAVSGARYSYKYLSRFAGHVRDLRGDTRTAARERRPDRHGRGQRRRGGRTGQRHHRQAYREGI